MTLLALSEVPVPAEIVDETGAYAEEIRVYESEVAGTGGATSGSAPTGPR